MRSDRSINCSQPTLTYLLERVQQGEPDLVEVTAVASVLHSFYNGLENIFLSIAKGIDGHVPVGPQSHRDLLVQMAQPRTNRGAVISTELAQEIVAYLGFRHFYRHSYSFFLDWSKLDELVLALQKVWTQATKELNVFLDNLRGTKDNVQGDQQP